MSYTPSCETLQIEFKRDQGEGLSDNDIVENVVALANTDGGFLYLGIEDSGKISGAIAKHCDVHKLQAMIANRTNPSQQVVVTLLTLPEGLPVMRIAVSFASLYRFFRHKRFVKPLSMPLRTETIPCLAQYECSLKTMDYQYLIPARLLKALQ